MDLLTVAFYSRKARRRRDDGCWPWLGRSDARSPVLWALRRRRLSGSSVVPGSVAAGYRQIRPLESAEPKAPEEPLPEPGWLAELNEQRRVFREELEARQNVMTPAEDPDWEDEGPAWPQWHAQREAILQPPKPEIRPAEGVLEAAHQRDTEREGV